MQHMHVIVTGKRVRQPLLWWQALGPLTQGPQAATRWTTPAGEPRLRLAAAQCRGQFTDQIRAIRRRHPAQMKCS
jgi:hypothetical protein